MTHKADYYELLGVSRTASVDDIKKAYRKLAMKHHPDKHGGHHKEAEAKFKEINEAYDVLRDEQKRAAYDRFGHAAFDNNGMGAGFGGFDFAGGLGDIFDEMFGEILGGRRSAHAQQSPRGADLRHDLTLTLEEAFQGVEKTIKILSLATCADCKGQGTAPGTSPVMCSMCEGHGRVRAQQGFFTIERTCPACQGAGRVIKDPCKHCHGVGRVRKERTLAVNVPSGVEDGTRIRLAGEGESGQRGGPPGDLYVIIAVTPHSLFQREGANLYCRVPVPMTLAALGGTVDVPVIDGGTTDVKVPTGVQSGHQVRIKHKGMSVLRGPVRGDLYVELVVETPVHLTKRQKELLQEFAEEAEKHKTHPASENFFRKVKEHFG